MVSFVFKNGQPDDFFAGDIDDYKRTLKRLEEKKSKRDERKEETKQSIKDPIDTQFTSFLNEGSSVVPGLQDEDGATMNSFAKFVQKQMYKKMHQEMKGGIFEALPDEDWVEKYKASKITRDVGQKFTQNFISKFQDFDEGLWEDVVTHVDNPEDDDDFFSEGKFKYIVDDDETIAPLKKGRKSIGSSATFEEYDIFEVDKDLFIQDSDKFPYIKDDTPHIWAYANKWAADKDVPVDDQSFDKNKGCKFQFDQEYVFVNLKHHRLYGQAGFQIIQNKHQQISASSSKENPKY